MLDDNWLLSLLKGNWSTFAFLTLGKLSLLFSLTVIFSFSSTFSGSSSALSCWKTKLPLCLAPPTTSFLSLVNSAMRANVVLSRFRKEPLCFWKWEQHVIFSIITFYGKKFLLSYFLLCVLTLRNHMAQFLQWFTITLY